MCFEICCVFKILYKWVVFIFRLFFIVENFGILNYFVENLWYFYRVVCWVGIIVFESFIFRVRYVCYVIGGV